MLVVEDSMIIAIDTEECFRSLGLETVAVQGTGKVAHGLMTLLHRDGAKLVVADIDAEKTAKVAADGEQYEVRNHRL